MWAKVISFCGFLLFFQGCFFFFFWADVPLRVPSLSGVLDVGRCWNRESDATTKLQDVRSWEGARIFRCRCVNGMEIRQELWCRVIRVG